MNRHPASIYQTFRGKLFGVLHKNGSDSAYDYLETGIKGKLYNQAYAGLKAELDFYMNYDKDFNLTVAGDYGDKTDFVGFYNGRNCRIDVTTNVKFKELKSYESFQKNGKKYFIALMDAKNGEMVDFIDVNFPFCPHCGGRLFDVLVLGPTKRDSEGIPYFGINDISIIRLCPYDPSGDSVLVERAVDSPTFNFPELVGSLPTEEEFKEVGLPGNRRYKTYEKMLSGEVTKYAIDNIRYFGKYFSRNIVAAGSGEYIITDPRNGDGYWGTPLRWIAPIVRKALFEEIEIDLSEF